MPIFNAGQDPFWIPKFRRAVCSLSMSSIQALFIWISKEKYFIHIQFSSVQSLSRVRLFVITRPPSPSPTPRVHSDSHPLSRWCHPAISSSVIPFSSFPQSLPGSESFPVSQLFAGGGQSTGVSALASVHPKNTQGWSPSEWTGWISLAVQGTLKSLLQHHGSKESILWHAAFFTVQLSHPYMTTGKTIALTRWTFVGKVMSLLCWQGNVSAFQYAL